MLDFQAARYLAEDEVAGQVGNDHPTSVPTSLYPCSDGWANIAVSGEVIWKRFARAMGHPNGSTTPTTRTRRAERRTATKLNAAIAEATGKMTEDGRAGREAGRGRRALRPGLQDGRGLRRPAGAPSRHGGRHRHPALRPDPAGRPAGPADAHAHQHGRAPARPGRAHATRSWPRSASTRPRSPNCEVAEHHLMSGAAVPPGRNRPPPRLARRDGKREESRNDRQDARDAATAPSAT